MKHNIIIVISIMSKLLTIISPYHRNTERYEAELHEIM